METADPRTRSTGRPARRRGRRAWFGWAAAALVAVLALYGVVLAVAPSLDRPAVARGGWRLYKCQELGGSIPPEFVGGIGLAPGYDILTLTSVHDGDVVYVAGTVRDAEGRDLGPAVWTAGWRSGGPVAPVRAANDLAEAVASSPGSEEAAPSAGPLDAAEACAGKASHDSA